MGFGYIYELQVDVESTPDSRVLEVIEYENSQRYVVFMALIQLFRSLSLLIDS